MWPEKITLIDVETTGLNPQADRVIEVAAIRVEDEVEVDRFESLVNPERDIPEGIEILTGIKAAQLTYAPTFAQIAARLKELLADCVLVAHNSRFDYSFLKAEFKRIDVGLRSKELCTVKLSRALYPEALRHDLSSIIDRLAIEGGTRHRAMADIEAVWRFMQRIKESFEAERVAEAVKTAMGKVTVPLMLGEAAIEELPEGAGVYVMYGENGMPLYVGKSIHIKQRVKQHFQDGLKSVKEARLRQEVAEIRTVRTAGDLGAGLKEIEMIGSLKPLYNRVARRAESAVVVRVMEDDKGYEKLIIEEKEGLAANEAAEAVAVFKDKRMAKRILLELKTEEQLCGRFTGTEATNRACFDYQMGKCKGACVGKEKAAVYNLRQRMALIPYRLKPWPFEGRVMIAEADEEAENYYTIDRWIYLGGGGTIEAAAEREEGVFNWEIYKVLKRHINTGKIRLVKAGE